MSIQAGTVFHRIGGGSLCNLRLKPAETRLNPSGFSVLTGGMPGEAAKQVRDAFPNAAGLHKVAETVASTTLEEIRAAGFDAIPDPTRRFPNHARITHPQGLAGFTDENLEKLSKVFKETTGC